MAQFEVVVRQITIEPHENAEKLELAEVFGYKSIVQKGEFHTGDLAIYIPEASIVPQKLIDHIGLTGRLAGKNKDRVKAVRLRGVLSQGITIKKDGLEDLFGVDQPPFEEGSNWQDYLGITKYIPEIPLNMGGEMAHVSNDMWKSYTDIENIKRWPNIIQEGEEIVATEKLHGTCFIGSLLWNDYDSIYEWHVSSKGIAAKHGASLKENDVNLYWKVSKELDLQSKALSLTNNPNVLRMSEITFFGEVLGVQDLRYNCTSGRPGFRLFDIRINGDYVSYGTFLILAQAIGVDTVPLLYRGSSISECLTFTSGKSTMDGVDHIREGIVIKTVPERYVRDLGRVILKSISPDYLVRGGDTTEME